MRRLPKDGRYPAFPSSDEDSEFTPSATTVFLARLIFVCLCAIVILGMCALILLMIHSVVELGGRNGQ